MCRDYNYFSNIHFRHPAKPTFPFQRTLYRLYICIHIYKFLGSECVVGRWQGVRQVGARVLSKGINDSIS